MHLTEGDIYHVFNRGNNSQPIFFNLDNYSFFMQSVRKYLGSKCDMIAWCLMPNHFHFLVHANSHSTEIVKDGSFERQQFSQGIKMLLSSYTKALNKQQKRTGSLFQQNTKALHIPASKNNPAQTVFHYIHQNPMKAKLVSKMEDWDYSSFKDYIGKRNGTLCNKTLAKELLDLDLTTLFNDSYKVINFEFDY
jgi:putative transposase